MEIIFDSIALATWLASLVAYAILGDNEDQRNTVCFVTSLILGILYICLSVLNVVAYHYIKPFTVIITDNTELNIIIKSIWVAFVAFVLYGITVVAE